MQVGAPEAGLPYRLHVPSRASRERRARLIVWLHPGWAHDNDEVEQLAGAFAQRGYALLVPTQPLSVRGWSAMESGALLAATLPEVESRGEVDTSRPILLGHGAGGDQALELWLNEPCRFRGIAVSSARPLLNGRAAGEVPGLLEACPGRAPVLAVLGEVDRAAREWRAAEPSWRAAGVDLTVRIARMRGYREWLFEGAQAQALLRWLEGLDAPGSHRAAHVAKRTRLQ
ncbi:MAG TPA: hypothetical protein VFO83_08870 [Aggregicoccus sp.]|nr:hypothetical protein [Aggregicoccus sp.]